MAWFLAPFVGYTLDTPKNPLRFDSLIQEVNGPMADYARQSKSLMEISSSNPGKNWAVAEVVPDSQPTVLSNPPKVMNFKNTPLWDISQKKDGSLKIPVILGRSATGKGARQRYPSDEFIIYMPNAGVSSENTLKYTHPSLITEPEEQEFDVACSFDDLYSSKVAKEWLRAYRGHQLMNRRTAMASLSEGPMTVFEFHTAPTGAWCNQTICYVMSFLAMCGYKDIIIAGCDLLSGTQPPFVPMAPRREKTLNTIQVLKDNYQARFWRDPECLFKELGPDWTGQAGQ